MIIEDVKLSDIDELVELEKKCFDGPTAYDYDMLMQAYTASGGMAYKIASESQIAGYIMAAPLYGSKVSSAVDIESVAVLPEHRGRGIGKALMLKVEEEAKKRGYKYMVLEVREKNMPALSLYRKLGYTPLERLPYYYTYENGESRHGIRMTRAL